MKTNNATNGIERQDHLDNLLLVLFYIAGALVAGMLCFANGDAGAALGVLALFVLHALVITLGAPQADPQPCLQRRRVADGQPTAVAAELPPAEKLATRSMCWRFWPKNSRAKAASATAHNWSFWPQNGHEQAFAR